MKGKLLKTKDTIIGIANDNGNWGIIVKMTPNTSDKEEGAQPQYKVVPIETKQELPLTLREEIFTDCKNNQWEIIPFD